MTNLHKTLTAVVVTLLALALLSAAVAMAASYSPSANSPKPFVSQANETIDVAVTAIVPDLDLPYEATEGDVVTLNVTVENKGTSEATFDVELKNETDDKDIISQEVTLDSGASQILDMDWDTSGFSTDPPPNLPGLPGKPHSLAATATLENDSDLTNNTLATGELPAQGVLLKPNPNPDPDPDPEPTNTPTPTPTPTNTPTPTPTPTPTNTPTPTPTHTPTPTPTGTPTPTPTEIYFPDGQSPPQATFRVPLVTEEPDITTNATPPAAIWHSPADAKLGEGLESKDIQTMATPAAKLFIGGSAVTFRSGGKFLHPFRRGEVIGRVRLEGSKSSRGAFLDIGGEVHYVAQDGGFLAVVAAGVMDIYIRAPGYVPVLIPGVAVEPGDRVTIPDLTLPFGDANGDGVIDIHDLSIAAGNYGATIETKPVR